MKFRQGKQCTHTIMSATYWKERSKVKLKWDQMQGTSSINTCNSGRCENQRTWVGLVYNWTRLMIHVQNTCTLPTGGWWPSMFNIATRYTLDVSGLSWVWKTFSGSMCTSFSFQTQTVHTMNRLSRELTWISTWTEGDGRLSQWYVMNWPSRN